MIDASERRCSSACTEFSSSYPGFIAVAIGDRVKIVPNDPAVVFHHLK
jgi:hypothetical protein